MGSVTKVKGENGAGWTTSPLCHRLLPWLRGPIQELPSGSKMLAKAQSHIGSVLSVPGVSVQFPQGGGIVGPTASVLPEALGRA